MNRPRRRRRAGESRSVARARGGDGRGDARRGAAAGVTVTTSTSGLARRVTPVGVSSGGEEGWKREYDWFVRVAIHGGRRCRLESALFLDPARSVSLVSRETPEVDGGGGGRGRSFPPKAAENAEAGETENTGGRPTGAA